MSGWTLMSPLLQAKFSACCQHSWTEVTLPSWGKQSCGLAPGAPRALSSPCCCSLPAWPDLPVPQPQSQVSTCVYAHIYLCAHTGVFIHIPHKNPTHKESIIHWKTATRQVTQSINNKLAPFCAGFLHEIQACDSFFLNSRRLSGYFLVSLSIFFSLS